MLPSRAPAPIVARPSGDADRPEPGEIDDDPARHRRVAAVAVAARLRDDVHAVRARPVHRCGDVLCVERLDDGERLDRRVVAVEDRGSPPRSPPDEGRSTGPRTALSSAASGGAARASTASSNPGSERTAPAPAARRRSSARVSGPSTEANDTDALRRARCEARREPPARRGSTPSCRAARVRRGPPREARGGGG